MIAIKVKHGEKWFERDCDNHILVTVKDDKVLKLGMTFHHYCYFEKAQTLTDWTFSDIGTSDSSSQVKYSEKSWFKGILMITLNI